MSITEEGGNQHDTDSIWMKSSLAPTKVVPIPEGELRVINTDPHKQREKGLILVPTLQGETIWVHPDIVESQQ